MPGDSSLRPYYDHDTFNAGYSVIYKPGIGVVDTATDKPIIASLGQSLGNSLAGKGVGINGIKNAGNRTSFSSVGPGGDKNYVYDLEFSEYFDFSNLSELLKNLFWNFFKNYCKVVVSQPLEIVRLVLQVGYFDFSTSKPRQTSKNHRRLAASINSSTGSMVSEGDLLSSSEGEEEIDFFQSTHGEPPMQKSVVSKKQKPVSKTSKIQPVSAHTVDILTAIASKDGPFALFRGVNASFIHHTLLHTIEAWITGFLSPFLGIPDPFFLDFTHSTEPAKSLWLSVSACVLAGVVLMPLDLIKVKLMLTQFNKVIHSDSNEQSPSATSGSDEEEQSAEKVKTRSVRESIKYYPIRYVLHPPFTITLLTVLHQFSTTVFRKASPYILFIRYNVDAYSAPNWYTMANLFLSIAELFIKLPMENLLRKEQVRFLLTPKSSESDPHRVVTIDNPDEDLIVTFNNWDAAHAHRTNGELSLWQRIRLLGLFNGWRVGVLNVIGFWGYNIFRSSEVLTEEKL
ncbi:hypothetical protein FDK38_002446 [Candidozyma auris]|nr:hypothetical protein FDK38_002446 [[Candida] auris]